MLSSCCCCKNLSWVFLIPLPREPLRSLSCCEFLVPMCVGLSGSGMVSLPRVFCLVKYAGCGSPLTKDAGLWLWTCLCCLLLRARFNFVLVFLSVDSSDCGLLPLLPLSIDCLSKNPATELFSLSMVLFRFCRSTDTLPLSFSNFLANYGPSLVSSVSKIALLMRLSSFFSCF